MNHGTRGALAVTRRRHAGEGGTGGGGVEAVLRRWPHAARPVGVAPVGQRATHC
ncbi:MAG: hypothetical protein M5U01_18160 [Ardenticatenaceae bacterium]|nr:hypothetical protein [Ardenticatenaceae bacterium]